MSSGYYLTAPFLYFNLGSHMMYILRNRLEAQQVRSDKALKILEDIAQAIFKQQFIPGLLVPQDPFNINALKDVFSKLAHSSIMKLDQASMDKLFYLMLMSIKKQFFLTSSPLQLHTLTVSHLLNLVKCLDGTQALRNMKLAIQSFQRVTSQYSFMQYLEIRQSILCELESYQTKIVNFIESGHQTGTGNLIFKVRNQHNQKSLGIATNQNDLDISNGTTAKQSLNTLFYKNWTTWKTSLITNFVEDYKTSSENRKKKLLQTNSYSRPRQADTSKANSQKSLGDMFNLKSENLGQFQVNFDILEGYNSSKTMQQPQKLKQSDSKKPVQKNIISGTNNSSAALKQKINKEFSQVKIGKKQDQEEDDIDLLEMMDS